MAKQIGQNFFVAQKLADGRLLFKALKGKLEFRLKVSKSLGLYSMMDAFFVGPAIVIKLVNLPVAQHKVVDGLHVWWVQLYGVGGVFSVG